MGNKHVLIFDEKNENHNPDPEHNYIFVKSILIYCGNILNMRGHLLLNDVYDVLGFPRTSEGCVEGWISSEGSFGWDIESVLPSDIRISLLTQGDIHNEI